MCFAPDSGTTASTFATGLAAHILERSGITSCIAASSKTSSNRMYGATSRTKAPREPSFPAPFALQETRTTWSPVSASAALSSITTTGSPWCEPTCVRMGMSLELGPIAPCTIYEGRLEDFRIGTPEAAFPTRCLIFQIQFAINSVLRAAPPLLFHLCVKPTERNDPGAATSP